MTKQIRPYISDEAYDALVAMSEEGGWKQADVVSAALVRMRQGETAQRIDVIQTQLQYVLMTLQHICAVNGWTIPEDPEEPRRPQGPGVDAPASAVSEDGAPSNPVTALTEFYHMTDADFGPAEVPAGPEPKKPKRSVVHKLFFKESR